MPGTEGMPSAETDRVRRIWEKLAPKYDREIAFYDTVLFAGSRRWIRSQAEGVVLEVGVGTGRNLDRYPPRVRLTGIDLSTAMLEPRQAESPAAELGNARGQTGPPILRRANAPYP
ncbi:MAG: class I SAM-dependent methyltransferase [Candidatus Dormibacteraeota bacterium]|nr:class I SAM-dependent methyltransferase [Candidatus Dormibacteraeota bacterium]